jgi:hypothetical protein
MAWRRLWTQGAEPYDPVVSSCSAAGRRAEKADHNPPGSVMNVLTIATHDGWAEWLTAMGTLALALATVIAVWVTVNTARADRRRDDIKRKEDRDYDAKLRGEADDKWEARRLAEQRQREDDDAQQQVIVEFLPGGPRSMPGRAVVDSADGITNRIVVTTTAAYPVKGLDVRMAHHANNGISITGTGRAFDGPFMENGQVRHVCYVAVSPQMTDPAPVVRFTDRNGNLYYSYLGFTRRFSQNTDFTQAAVEIDKWVRTGPKPDEPAG